MEFAQQALGALRRVVADDSHAATHQSLGQYRSALLAHIDLVARATLPAGENAMYSIHPNDSTGPASYDAKALAALGEVAIAAAETHPDLCAGIVSQLAPDALPVLAGAPDAHAILTRSGHLFSFLAPEKCVISIEDIAHALANECRFGGHVHHFYSVAQHSLLVSQIVPPEDALAALLHDAPEAYVKEIPKPLKRLLPDYMAVERRVEAEVFARFGLPATLPPSVKYADLVLLATEKRDLLSSPASLVDAVGVEPLATRIFPMSPALAERMFLQRYRELTSQPAEEGAQS